LRDCLLVQVDQHGVMTNAQELVVTSKEAMIAIITQIKI
jgi:hypothetical protein